MLQIFRNNQFFTVFWLLLYLLPFAVAVWIRPLPEIEYAEEKAGLIIAWLYPLLWENSSLAKIFFLILVFIQAYSVNWLVNEMGLAKRNTYITAILYILAVFSFAGNHYVSPAFLANTILIVVLVNLFLAYEKKASVVLVFNAGFWLSIAALIYFPTIYLAVFILIAWSILRTFDTKEFIIILSGVAIPFFLMGSYLYLKNSLMGWLQGGLSKQLAFFSSEIEFGTMLWLSIALWSFWALWALIKMQGLKNKTSIKEQKFIDVLFWMLLLASLSCMGVANLSISHFALLFIPISILFSLNLQLLKKNSLAEFIHLACWLICMLVQFQAWLVGI